ncbi:hypothetical protein QTH90_26470 [Variovorax sp. J2P1-59]|uniref:hypothetical protein n=1 Tax=Variovorax flavidus TaxID=3053501 RepID=UPI0025782172|nr:hypothetical protein [Variovorax sp. J2P1-59]MDM0077982.1 hypothetical protein [Variovorax sp. J2P1-59]
MTSAARQEERLDDEDRRVDEIVRRGPSGTFAVAGVATAIVVAIYFIFYIFAYLPRGAVQ